MRMLVRFDFFLWNHFMPRLNAGFFRWKLNSLLAMAYISFYHLPRKFLMNYFFGKGKSMIVDSRQLIVRNQEVLNQLTEKIQSVKNFENCSGTLQICQTSVDDPNFKYSVGSFNIEFHFTNSNIILNVHSYYRFKDSSNRISKHLHNWLFAMKNNGRANDFKIESEPWQTSLQELKLLQAENSNKRSSNFRLLV